MKNLFAGLLPPGWTAKQQLGDPRVYAVHDDRGNPVQSLLVDSVPLEARQPLVGLTFPDAPPSMYLRRVGLSGVLCVIRPYLPLSP